MPSHVPSPPIQRISILREGSVAQLIGVCGDTVRRWVKAGTFPPPIRLGPRALGWRVEEIEKWLASRPQAR